MIKSKHKPTPQELYSEKKRREEEERDRVEAEAEGRLTWQEVADEVLPTPSQSISRTARERRRTSISVSRIGQIPESPTDTRSSSTRPSRSSSIVLTRPTFYQLDTNRVQSGSADSFASSAAD